MSSTSNRTMTATHPHADARITFDQFKTYAAAYLHRRDRLVASCSSRSQLSWLTYATRWTWIPPLRPGVALERSACLERSFSMIALPSSSSSSTPTEVEDEMDQMEEEQHSEDQAIQSVQQVQRVINVHQTISYSNIWQLPVLHFTAYTAAGEAIGVEELRRCGVVHPDGTLHQQQRAEHEQQEKAEEDDEEQVMPISIADHPRSGLPSFYLHPCHTRAALQGVLSQNALEQQDEKQTAAGWTYIAAFVNLCSSAVEMRAS